MATKRTETPSLTTVHEHTLLLLILYLTRLPVPRITLPNQDITDIKTLRNSSD